jgi:hypothetical protein
MKASELRQGQFFEFEAIVAFLQSRLDETRAAMASEKTSAKVVFLTGKASAFEELLFLAKMDSVTIVEPAPITSTNVLTGEQTQWEFATSELQEKFVQEASTPEPQPLAFTIADKLRQERESQPLQLAEGKYYERRDGEIVGPLSKGCGKSMAYIFGSHGWYASGKMYIATETGFDLIREVPPPVSERVAEADSIQYAATERDADGVWFGQPDSDGWIEWHGGECPVDVQSSVQVRYCTGGNDIGTAGGFYWDHRPNSPKADIVAYRVVPPEPPTPKQYRPFASAAEFKPHRDRWMRSKQVPDFVTKPSAFSDRGVWVGHASVANEFDELLRDFEFDNGEPCGVEVQ